MNNLPGAMYPMVPATIVRWDESELRNRAVPKSETLGSQSELGKSFPLLLLCMFVSLLFVSICKVLILFVVMHVFFLTNTYFSQL